MFASKYVHERYTTAVAWCAQHAKSLTILTILKQVPGSRLSDYPYLHQRTPPQPTKYHAQGQFVTHGSRCCRSACHMGNQPLGSCSISLKWVCEVYSSLHQLNLPPLLADSKQNCVHCDTRSTYILVNHSYS